MRVIDSTASIVSRLALLRLHGLSYKSFHCICAIGHSPVHARQWPSRMLSTTTSQPMNFMDNKPVAKEPLQQESPMADTQVVSITPSRVGDFVDTPDFLDRLPLDDWTLNLHNSPDAHHLKQAAELLRHSSIPVAFPTETVYGLGADATRSEAVRGIYKAKQRPSDNPLIVHIASLKQLRSLLHGSCSATSNAHSDSLEDPIPDIYKPLIRKFWPGPLTILLPVPETSPLAPETTAGLRTFGARMPRNLLALALIKLADRPIAAPSANASTKPSPTAAEHVLHDLEGRIDLILDGGPCDVGVESTVVDGLYDPPVILRPGGISIGQLKEVEGWHNVQIAYEDKALVGGVKGGPRAPGMKYRHYSPKAKVILFDSGRHLTSADFRAAAGNGRRLGVVRTRSSTAIDDGSKTVSNENGLHDESAHQTEHTSMATPPHPLQASRESPLTQLLAEQSWYHSKQINETTISADGGSITLLEVSIGPQTDDVARGLFSALRDLDRRDVDAILVEGIEDGDGDDVSAAVMNRLRKAAEVSII